MGDGGGVFVSCVFLIRGGWHSLKQLSLLGRARDTFDGTGPTCYSSRDSFEWLLAKDLTIELNINNKNEEQAREEKIKKGKARKKVDSKKSTKSKRLG